MNGSAADDRPTTSDEVVCGTSTNQLGRLRELQIALRGAKLPFWVQVVITHLGAHCNDRGETWVTEDTIADNLGYKSRGTVSTAIGKAKVAGFVDRVKTPERDLWIIPLMRSPLRDARVAQGADSLRDSGDSLRDARVAQLARRQSRAPSEETVSNKRREPDWLRPERSVETIEAIQAVRGRLRSNRQR